MHLFKSNRLTASKRPTVAITIGDPFGVGPEIVLKALASQKLNRLADFLIVGDKSVLIAISQLLKSDFRLRRNDLMLDLNLISKDKIKFGRLTSLSGKASLAYIDCALKLIRDKKADCLVTAPVSKEAINKSGVKFSGHTEYLAKKFDTKYFAMMLVGGSLKVTLVTRHISLSSVPKAVTKGEILKCVDLTYKTLARYFGINRPKIGVASLNPHSGEGGSIGIEEKRVIKPAVSEAKARYKNVVGPVSSEALFYDAYRGKLDCVITMYHDQGLTPLKMVARDKSVNVTLGLPFVRTSPGHGTAFDIAGKGIARADSMIEAINMAIRMVKKGEIS